MSDHGVTNKVDLEASEQLQRSTSTMRESMPSTRRRERPRRVLLLRTHGTSTITSTTARVTPMASTTST